MTSAPLKITEMVRKVNVDTPAANGQDQISMGNTLRFHIPYVGGNAILNPQSLIIRGELTLGNDDTAFFVDNGMHCLFSTMRVMHGDRVIELIERYDDFAEWYLSLHTAGRWGTNTRLMTDFAELGNYQRPTNTATYLLPRVSSADPIGSDLAGPVAGKVAHAFCFQPLSAIMGSRAVKDKFPLCVLNPMEPLTIEFDLDPLGTQVNWGSTSTLGTFYLTNCYLNADYDMVGVTLGQQLKTSMSGIEWDIPGLEKHERDFQVPEYTYAMGASHGWYSWGHDEPPDFPTEFHVRSNVQAMTRMIHYFKNKNYDRVPVDGITQMRNFLTYPEVTKWQYQIANQPVPDRAITAQLYAELIGSRQFPRAHFGRMWMTSMKTAGAIALQPKCGLTPKMDFAWDYGKKLPPTDPPSNSPGIFSLNQPWQNEDTDRGDDGTFFLAYDFTRQPEHTERGAPWGDGSFRLRDTEFIVQLGFCNRIGIQGFQAGQINTVDAWPMVIVTLVEYKRRLVIDKLGRLDAYF